MTWPLLAIVCGGLASAQVVTYEGDVLPEAVGWVSYPFCEPGRGLIGGSFQQSVGACLDYPPPSGQQEDLLRGLEDFVGSDTLFLEWRAESTGPASEMVWVAPAAVVVGGDSVAGYHFTFARDQVRLIRDNLLPILFYPLAPGSPHTFRLELFNAGPAYVLYIDGERIEEGDAEGPFPQTASAVIGFRAKSQYHPSLVRWDFIRYGVLPQDASFDYDSDGAATLFDYYFVHDCLTKAEPGIFGGPKENAGPGCRFTDFDADADVDLLDFAEFQNLFGTSHP